jgi:hypothetical protein
VLTRAPGTDDDRRNEWSTTLDDEVVGTVRLSGRLDETPGATTLVLVVHGLGGNAESHYIRPVVQTATARGWSCLRMVLRGADLSGDDIYHAGLVADLHAALQSPAVARYEKIYVLGFSLGGHVALRLALEPAGIRDSRVAAIAAVCPPLSLSVAATLFDRRRAGIYRHYVLEGLRRITNATARKHAARGLQFGPELPGLVGRIRSIRQWDGTYVAPRFGFRDAEHYYQSVSVGPHLRNIEVPALIVASDRDPMVPPQAIEPWAVASSRLTVRWTDQGGHVGFPSSLNLGLGSATGLVGQTFWWFANH